MKTCSKTGGDTTKRIGIFLGRLQPFHEGHQWLIKNIFNENDEIVICIGSAQRINPGDIKADRNPLAADERIARVRRFIAERKLIKPYRIVTVEDIDSDDKWPAYLASAIGIEKTNQADRYKIYFGEEISEEYRAGLNDAGIGVKIVQRQKFEHLAPDKKIYVVECATEIRKIYKKCNYKI